VGRRPTNQPRPQCPAYPNSHVVLDGRYGPREHRRPRYRCYPGGVGGKGEEWHRFTEPLPRQMTDGGMCVVCERDVHPHEGPQTPRTYEFAARHIAEALVAVGAGATYRDAAARVRRRAGRFPLNADGSQRYSRHGQLVADCVELFAPVVFEPHRRDRWAKRGQRPARPHRVPSQGLAGGRDAGDRPVAFNVLAASGYENRGRALAVRVAPAGRALRLPAQSEAPRRYPASSGAPAGVRQPLHPRWRVAPRRNAPSRWSAAAPRSRRDR